MKEKRFEKVVNFEDSIIKLEGLIGWLLILSVIILISVIELLDRVDFWTICFSFLTGGLIVIYLFFLLNYIFSRKVYWREIK